MRIIFSWFLIFFFLSTVGQNNLAVLNIYNPKQFYGIGTNTHIIINGVKVCRLKMGGYLEYKVLENNNLTIQIYTTALGVSTDISEFNLTLEKGNNYYYKIRFIGNKTIIEQLNSPPPKKKLKDKRFVSFSDSKFNSNYIDYNHPKTKWTKEGLKKYWAENGAKDIEGIYEKVGIFLKYELAVLKEDNEYKIIYLSGATGNSWYEGDLKATLNKTANFGIFKCNWYMLNKTLNNNFLLTFDKNSSMSVIPQDGEEKSMYLKIYPTYDEVSEKMSSKWKGNGTGFFIDKTGYLATNYHVVKDANDIEVEFIRNGIKQSFSAKVIQSDKQNDLSIIKINSSDFKPFSKLPYNFKTNISDVGSNIFALGYPMALSLMGTEIKFTDGKISSKTGIKGDITTYQISVPIQPGNSGGPLFDYDGNLIGITSSGINRKLDITENVNYAIKSSYLKNLVDVLDYRISLPNDSKIANKTLTEKIKILSNYVVLIKIK